MAATRYRPDLYDVIHGRRRHDVEWYIDLAKKAGGRVLELGAGTGRTALPIARAGVMIDALDLSAEMREQLARRVAAEPEAVRDAITVLAGDMADFALPDRYALILIPFRSFLHNTTHARQLACLRACRTHLARDGTLAFDVFQPSDDYMSDFEGAFEGVGRMDPPHRLEDGGMLLLTEWNRYDRVAKTVEAVHRYDLLAEDGTLRESLFQVLDLATLYPADLLSLLKASGFTEIELGGNFTGRPLGPDDADISILAR